MCFIPFRWIPVYVQQQQPLSEIERSKASVSTDKVTYAYFTFQCLEHKLRKPSSRKMESEGTWHAPDGDSRPREAGLPPVGNTGAHTTRLVTGGLSVR